MNMSLIERIVFLNKFCEAHHNVFRNEAKCRQYISESEKMYNETLTIFQNAYKNENGIGVLDFTMSAWPCVLVRITTDNAIYKVEVHYDNNGKATLHNKVQAFCVRNRKMINAEKKQILKAIEATLNNY